MIARRRNNRHRHTPIPGLADHMARINDKRNNWNLPFGCTYKEWREEEKSELASIRAAFADKVYAASEPIRKEE